LRDQHETQESVQALREPMQGVAQMFVERVSERTERESSGLLKRTMKSKRENDV